MLPMKKNEMETRYNQTKLVYICIMVSVFIYAFIVEMVKRSPNFLSQPQPDFEINTLRYILFGVGIATFFIIRKLRNYLLSKSGNSSFKRSMSAAAKLASIDIMTAALCETGAIYGLVLFFIGKRSDDFYILMALSVIYFTVYFPRFSNWEEWAKKNEAGV